MMHNMINATETEIGMVGGFAFDVGQCVNHRSGGMPSIVIGRHKTSKGREQYHLREIELGAHRYRVMQGDFLVPMSASAAECGACRCAKVCPLRRAN